MKIMNTKLLSFVFAAIVSICGLSSCGLDNVDEPESTFSGNIQYKGESLQLAGTGGQIQLQLYQPGYELHSPITVYVDQNGHFSAKLFDGDYKLVTKDNNGPWVNTRDTVGVKVKGNTVYNLEVTPYYLVEKYSIVLNGKQATLTFDIKKVAPQAKIAEGIVVLGNTSLVDNKNNVMAISIPASAMKEGANTFAEQTIPDDVYNKLKASNKAVARIGVKAEGATEFIFSKLIEIKF